jgi:hypothetical protein
MSGTGACALTYIDLQTYLSKILFKTDGKELMKICDLLFFVDLIFEKECSKTIVYNYNALGAVS